MGPDALEIVADAPIDATILGEMRRSEPERTDPDDALRAAIKAAVDAGDLVRASALLEILKATPKPAAVLALVKPGTR